MKKILVLIIILCSSLSFSQLKKPQLETITDISIRGAEGDTIFYKFESGKLKTKKEGSRNTTFFNYNAKGLVEKESRVFPDGSSYDVNYTYNEDGYLTELVRSKKEKEETTAVPWHKSTFTYSLTDPNNYIVNDVSEYLDSPSMDKRYRTYTMKDNVLTTSDKSGKFITEMKYKFANGNVVECEKIKPSKENYILGYDFDTKENVYKLLFENLFGDKYFINQMASRIEIYNHYTDFTGQNNCISIRKIKSKTLSFSENKGTVVYNNENLPVEIKTDTEPGFGYLVKTTYKN